MRHNTDFAFTAAVLATVDADDLYAALGVSDVETGVDVGDVCDLLDAISSPIVDDGDVWAPPVCPCADTVVGRR